MPSADKWIRKLWYIYTMEYYSAIKKNAFESVLMRWVKLEPIILGRKVMTKLISIKSSDITLPTKVRLVQAMVFPVVMYGFENWTIKKAEFWRINTFETWY